MIERVLGPISQLAFITIVLQLAPCAVQACGPFFPNRLLTESDAPVLVSPSINFAREIQRLQLVPKPAPQAKPIIKRHSEHSIEEQLYDLRTSLSSVGGYSWNTIEAELADLNAALTHAGLPPEKREAILNGHRQERAKIVILGEAETTLRPKLSAPPRIPRSLPDVTEGLPPEFADYFLGTIAWHEGVIADARVEWERLLGRPPAERHYKSTWAAYMLGKSWEEENRKKAIAYFQQVRALAKEGFADSLGLAAASLGWEARLLLREKKYERAIELYLEQAAAGDPIAINSLDAAAAFALRDAGAPLKALAANPKSQCVITAYLLSWTTHEEPIDMDGRIADAAYKLLSKSSYLAARVQNWHKMESPVLLWLKAVEKASVKDVASAEKLALVAYRAGNMDLAQRWVTRSRNTPVAQWLQAKLLLREGKLDAAAELLARASKSFALLPPSANLSGRELSLNLTVQEPDWGYWTRIPAADQSLGELGVLQLARRQYVEALDCLLRSTFWSDAAYVAERVLTLDELKNYVDQRWSDNVAVASELSVKDVKGTLARVYGPDLGNPTTWRQHEPDILQTRIRYLLARRLMRENRRGDAGPYFPDFRKAKYKSLLQALDTAENKTLPNERRARAYFHAAILTRYDGMELLGSEGEPDGAITAGVYTPFPTFEERIHTTNSMVLAATADERARATGHHPEPDKRFHYRYTAAALAWESAKLLPDNSDRTAAVLWLGGWWIQNNDPRRADPFYKALVRRCRKTALGSEADSKRWFPRRDDKEVVKQLKLDWGIEEEARNPNPDQQ